jgi:hypothetical protein
MKRSWLRSCTHEAAHVVVAAQLGIRVHRVEIYRRAQIDRHTGQRILGATWRDRSRERWRLDGDTWTRRRVDEATHWEDQRLIGLAGSVAEMIIVDGLTRDGEIVERVERRMSKGDLNSARGYDHRDVLRCAELIREHRAEINAEALRIFKNTARERTRG